jgi:putative transposase
MSPKVFKNRHYNTPGHAHELTFSTYRRKNLFVDTGACEMFLAELAAARAEYSFCIWAYVIMPNHVHLLLWPKNSPYKIEPINKTIKGRMAKKFVQEIKAKGNTERLEEYKIVDKGIERYQIWQKGGGFDRNLWNPLAVHQSIGYIEANPVRRRIVGSPEKYPWSSAFARANNTGVLPDKFTMPVLLLNPQIQKMAIV